MLQWGACAGLTADELARHEAEGMALADSLGDRALAGMIRGFSGSAMVWAGDLQGGLGGYLDAARRAEEIDEPDQREGVSQAVTAEPASFVLRPLHTVYCTPSAENCFEAATRRESWWCHRKVRKSVD